MGLIKLKPASDARSMRSSSKQISYRHPLVNMMPDLVTFTAIGSNHRLNDSNIFDHNSHLLP